MRQGTPPTATTAIPGIGSIRRVSAFRQQLPETKPTISSDRGVVNAASFRAGIAPRSWVTITGADLSATTRAWSGNDIVDGNLPTSLDGVSVSINGQPGYVQYISPAQINVIAPEGVGTGDVEVRVTSNGQTSDPVVATVQTVSPAFFLFDGKSLAATHADNSVLTRLRAMY